MTEQRSTTLATVVFAILVVATIGALFVTQRLKRSTPVVQDIHLPVYISPNGDGRKDKAAIDFRVKKADRVTVSIVNGAGDEVRRLADRHLSKGRHSFEWNGRDGAAAVLPDGFYYLRVVLRAEGRGTITRRGIQLVTKPPAAKLVSVAPNRIRAGGSQAVTVKFSGSANPRPKISVYRTGDGPPRLVTSFDTPIGSQEGVWDGRIGGRPAPAGTYAIAVTLQNKALVAGSAPKHLPPTAAGAAPRTGVTVYGLAAAPPLEPVGAGTTAHVGVSGPTGTIRWTLSQVGGGRVDKGSGHAPQLNVPIPRKAKTGLYALQLSSTSLGKLTVPLAVRGRAARSKVLVVLPAITWQGLNPVDDDRDGFPDTLDTTESIPSARAFAAPPSGYGSEVKPLLAYATAKKLGYDITTDLALARGVGPKLGGHRAIVFPGSERWFTEDLDAKLRTYVENGGKVASFGTDSLRRTVQLTPDALTDPSPAQETNALGERTSATRSEAAPLVRNADSLGLLSGTDGFVGLFTRFEQSQQRVGGATLLTGAGRDPDHPSFVAYKLGRGTVIRVGTPQWSHDLSSDQEVAGVTSSLWSFLSR